MILFAVAPLLFGLTIPAPHPAEPPPIVHHVRHPRHVHSPVPLPHPAHLPVATVSLPHPAPPVATIDDVFGKMATDLASMTPTPTGIPSTFSPTAPEVRQTPPPIKKGHAMPMWLSHFIEANFLFCLALGLYVLYMTVRHGFPWVQQKAASIFNSAKDDVTWLDGRVTVLEGTLGVATPAKPSAAVVAPVVKPAAPVLTKADVDAAVQAALAAKVPTPATPATPPAA